MSMTPPKTNSYRLQCFRVYIDQFCLARARNVSHPAATMYPLINAVEKLSGCIMLPTPLTIHTLHPLTLSISGCSDPERGWLVGAFNRTVSELAFDIAAEVSFLMEKKTRPSMGDTDWLPYTSYAKNFSSTKRTESVIRNLPADCDLQSYPVLYQYMYILIHAMKTEPTSEQSIVMDKFCEIEWDTPGSYPVTAFLRYATYRGYKIAFDKNAKKYTYSL